MSKASKALDCYSKWSRWGFNQSTNRPSWKNCAERSITLHEPGKSPEKGSKPEAPSTSPSKPAAADGTQLGLGEAKTNQKAIADQLQKMLDGLSEFETYRGVIKDAQELLKQHEQTMKQTDEAAAKPWLLTIVRNSFHEVAASSARNGLSPTRRNAEAGSLSIASSTSSVP